jgi:hypothetical protein
MLQVSEQDDPTTALVQNLSLKGVGVLVERDYEPEITLQVLLVNAWHTAALKAEMKVVRCFRVADHQYFLAGPFTRLLTHDELVPFII